MKHKTVHIIYSGLGGHFDYVFNLVHAMGANAKTHLLFFGVEPVPAYYLQKCTESGISYSIVLKTGFGFKAAWQILNVLRKEQADLIYVHSNAAAVPAYISKIRRGAKVVLIEHHNNQLKTAKDHKRSRFAQGKFDRVIFLTSTHLLQAKKIMDADFNESKSIVIQTGIPEEYFNAPRKKNPHHIRIGMQSRLVPIKDHETLIRAFKNVLQSFPTVELRIAGEGVEQARLLKLVEELGLENKVYFEGMLSKTDLMAWLGKLTIYVHATLGETSSIALMEALAQGLPVIASDVPGVQDFLTNDTAVLVAPKNVDQLHEALLDLLGDEKKCIHLSENAFTFAVANCSLQKMAAAYLKLEEDILK